LIVRVVGVAAVIARLLRKKAAANVAAKKVGKVRMMAPDGRDTSPKCCHQYRHLRCAYGCPKATQRVWLKHCGKHATQTKTPGMCLAFSLAAFY